MTEPEFVLLDEPGPAPAQPRLRSLRRSGRRRAQASVLIPVERAPHRGRLAIVLLVVLGAGAAFFLLRRRAAAQRRPDDLARLEDADEPIAMREPPIAAV